MSTSRPRERNPHPCPIDGDLVALRIQHAADDSNDPTTSETIYIHVDPQAYRDPSLFIFDKLTLRVDSKHPRTGQPSLPRRTKRPVQSKKAKDRVSPKPTSHEDGEIRDTQMTDVDSEDPGSGVDSSSISSPYLTVVLQGYDPDIIKFIVRQSYQLFFVVDPAREAQDLVFLCHLLEATRALKFKPLEDAVASAIKASRIASLGLSPPAVIDILGLSVMQIDADKDYFNPVIAHIIQQVHATILQDRLDDTTLQDMQSKIKPKLWLSLVRGGRPANVTRPSKGCDYDHLRDEDSDSEASASVEPEDKS